MEQLSLELEQQAPKNKPTPDQLLKAGLAEQVLYTGCRIEYLREEVRKLKEKE